jgi:pimeloyl-ACP methyl ester carboxylesterase
MFAIGRPSKRSLGRTLGSVVGVACLLIIVSCGCRINDVHSARKAAEIFSYGAPSMVQVRPVKRRSDRLIFANPVSKYFSGPALPSERTQQLLRSYNLLERLQSRPGDVIAWLQELVTRAPRMDEVHALAEVSKLQADWHQQNGNYRQANKLYAGAVLHSHKFLFDNELNLKRNAYDPQFRRICDIYNGSLESIMRELCKSGQLKNGASIMIGDEDLGMLAKVHFEGRWESQSFERFELVSDYKTEGLANQYRTYGLGVPLIAVMQKQPTANPAQKYYPPSLTLPMTAFCEIQPQANFVNAAGNVQHTAVIRMFDPLEQKTIRHLNRTIPLESDITTPLAYHLEDPLLNQSVLATATLLNAKLADKIHGMYMLEPFDPNKIPVVMVHGLWSSPVTWTQMFNDLRAVAEIQNNYQFWFYSYASGKPFMISAEQMREDLANIRRDFDPNGTSQALNQMVLVGHSMGGLLSRMQAIDSGNEFWNLVGQGNIEDLRGNQEAIGRLRKTLFFDANPAIKRIVTIATPHHGSEFASTTARWLSQKFISLPEFATDEVLKLAKENPDVLVRPQILTGTSIDSLAPTAPSFVALERITPQPNTRFNTITGKLQNKRYFPFGNDSEETGGDGVVSCKSAQCRFAESNVFVPEEHSSIHFHPQCILEVRRILLSHLVQQQRIKEVLLPVSPVSFEEPIAP